MGILDLFKRAPKAAPVRTINANWQAGKSGNRAFRDAGTSGPNVANIGYLQTARNRARDAVRNVPFAARAVELQITNIVGTGIVPRFADKGLQRLWQRFEDECDADGLRDIYGMQEGAVRAWMEGGEAFVRIRPRRLEDGLAAPLQFELLEADMLPLRDWTEPNGNRVVQGVEFNGIGKRVAYHFHKAHPNDNRGFDSSLLTRVPAEFVIHLYDPSRPGQVRGFPPLATVLQRMQQMNDFDEATLERQKLASALTVIITRPNPTDPGIDPITGEPMDGRASSEIAPGSAYQLLPGEDIKTTDLPSLGGEYEAFAKVNGRSIAAGFGVPYELLTGDFSGLSDRTARVIINEYRRRVEQHQWHRVVRQMMRPIHRAFVDAAILAGAAPAGVDDAVRWVPPAWPYFYPTQDVAAIEAEIRAGLRSQSDAIYSRGNDPDTVRAERKIDQDAERAAGLYSTTIVEPPDE